MLRDKKSVLSGLCVGILVLAVMTVVGCATIVHGTTQGVGISSTPTNAKVLVDGQSYGNAPVTAELSRKKSHVVRIELDGYEPYETTITRDMSGWVIGNVLSWGILGIVIDAVSGGIYELSPDQIDPTLKTAGVSQILDKDQSSIHIAVVLEPQSDWKKIGQLKRLDTFSE